MSKPAPTAYPFVTRKQIAARIVDERAFMVECANVLENRTQQRAAGAAPLGKAWGWMSSERVIAGRLVQKVRIGMLSSDEEAKLSRMVNRYSRQLADHHRALALAENPALSVAAEKFGVGSTEVTSPEISQAQPEPKEIPSRCHPLGNCQADDLEDDAEPDSELAPEDDLPRRAMEFVAANAGLRTDAIARALDVTTALLAPTLRMLVQGKQMKKQGFGRGTRYFAR